MEESKFSKIKAIITLSTYKPIYRQYGIIKANTNKIDWYMCRDKFHRQFNLIMPIPNEFLFCIVYPEVYYKVSSFLSSIEDKLNLEKRCKITNAGNCVLVELNEFWRNNLRSKLFTILIRASLSHNSIEEAIEIDPLLKRTKPAVNRFLEGYTKYDGISGWHNTFRRSESEKLLVRESSIVS